MAAWPGRAKGRGVGLDGPPPSSRGHGSKLAASASPAPGPRRGGAIFCAYSRSISSRRRDQRRAPPTTRRAAKGWRRRKLPPDAIPSEAQVAVGGVAVPKFSREQIREDLGPRDREQRPHEAVGPPLARTRERREAAPALACDELAARVRHRSGARSRCGRRRPHGHLHERGVAQVARAGLGRESELPRRPRRQLRPGTGRAPRPAPRVPGRTRGRDRPRARAGRGGRARRRAAIGRGGDLDRREKSAVESAPPETAIRIRPPGGRRSVSAARERAPASGCIGRWYACGA